MCEGAFLQLWILVLTNYKAKFYWNCGAIRVKTDQIPLIYYRYVCLNYARLLKLGDSQNQSAEPYIYFK